MMHGSCGWMIRSEAGGYGRCGAAGDCSFDAIAGSVVGILATTETRSRGGGELRNNSAGNATAEMRTSSINPKNCSAGPFPKQPRPTVQGSLELASAPANGAEFFRTYSA